MHNKTVIFYDDTFPFDGARPNANFFNHFDHFIVSTTETLEEDLSNPNVTTFIHLHGSYFPKKAWPTIYDFLSSGKGFIHIGGAPFRVPCFLESGEWKKERVQTAYHQKLNIHGILEVSSQSAHSIQHNPNIPLYSENEDLFSIQDTYNFVLHVTKSSTIEAEMGSVGPMDARIYPLLTYVSSDNRHIAAPSILMENLRGKFAGGRWIFINTTTSEKFWQEKGQNLVQKIVNFATSGVTDMWLKSNYATYEQGERAKITFQIQSFHTKSTTWNLTCRITKDGHDIHVENFSLQTTGLMQSHSFIIPHDIEAGFYKVTCYARSNRGETRLLHQGFWGHDQALLAEGEPLAKDRDYFQKDGRPLPIVGMTYMTSDVARYFLFLPNPARWDHDMAQMKKAGINYIRTGLWTAWRQMMFVDGHMDEHVLRSIDAFIHCAKKHDLHVTFNFFSFTPETWEGENPYLDPRSIEAQKRFITAIVSRHTDTTNVDWDLINEPSLFNPDRTFAGPQTINDPFDRKHFQQWLKKRHDSIQSLQEKWNMTEEELPSFSSIEPPKQEDINFSVRDMMLGKRGLKWLDYTLYTMDMHNKWADELTKTIKSLVPNHLVTVGQDEALAGQRPSPFFYSEVVDYTSNHSWWLLDDLIWDGIFTKTPHKPNLIQETGIMYVEQPNNQPRRSEEELRNILERKYAYAFSTGGAGAVQWLWNTNYFMNNINESNIGAIRADGTLKPETEVSYDFGAFMKEARDLFKGRKLEDVGVIYPYSNDFSNRKFAFMATTKLTRVLSYMMNVPFRAFSEYHLDELNENNVPKLLIIPSPHHFSHQGIKHLLSVVKHFGTTLLFTGPLNIDEYWHETNRLIDLFGPVNNVNIRREERLTINKKTVPVSFGGERIADTLKGNPTELKKDQVHSANYGQGNVI